MPGRDAGDHRDVTVERGHAARFRAVGARVAEPAAQAREPPGHALDHARALPGTGSAA